jgi:peptidoglycan L-alanyl-D-glutamate endopeptidase CwlK
MQFDAASEKRLIGVHPDLVKVARRAFELVTATGLSFRVIEGLRTLERQKQLVAAGASRTMKSRHLTGHAIDLAALVDGKVRWDWPLYAKLAVTMKSAAKVVKVPIEWGGDWRSFKDGPHFQLPWKDYL